MVVETGFGEYEFTHKAIQEYLTASYITKLPTLPSEFVDNHPHEMALAVALSSHSTKYCAAVIKAVLALKRRQLSRFSDAFLHRMLLERVDFIPDRELGALVILLSIIAYIDFEEYRSDALVAFLDVAAIRRSVREAFRPIRIYKNDDGSFLLRIPSDLAQLSNFQSQPISAFIEVSAPPKFFDLISR